MIDTMTAPYFILHSICYAAMLLSSFTHIESTSVDTICSSDESRVSLSALSASSNPSRARSSAPVLQRSTDEAHADAADPHGLPVKIDPDCFSNPKYSPCNRLCDNPSRNLALPHAIAMV